MNEKIGYLLIGVLAGVMGNFFVYFFIKTAESLLNFYGEVYLAVTIVVAIVFFGLIYKLYQAMKE